MSLLMSEAAFHCCLSKASVLKQSGKYSSGNAVKGNQESVYLDKHGKWRTFDKKKLSRKKGGSLRGRGWKYGSGFVDGIFPVLSPEAQQILKFVMREVDANKVCGLLDTLPPSHSLWDDLIDVSVQLRLSKRWDPIISVCEWLLYKSSFRPDVMCYNLLIDAFGQKLQHNKAESIYLQLLESHCVPTEDTYAILLKAYCVSGLLEKAEAVFSEMQKNGISPENTSMLLRCDCL